MLSFYGKNDYILNTNIFAIHSKHQKVCSQFSYRIKKITFISQKFSYIAMSFFNTNISKVCEKYTQFPVPPSFR